MTPSATQNWRDLSSIYLGCTLCLPVLVVGHELYHQYGLWGALGAIVLGNVLLFLLSLAAAQVGAAQRRSTPEQAVVTLGPIGGGVFSAAMGATMMVWFALQLSLMVQSLQELLPLPTMALTLFMGVVITYGVRRGIMALSAMATYSVPVLALALGWLLVSAPVPDLADSWHQPHSIQGLSFVIAVSIAMVIDIPTYARYCTSTREVNISSALLFLIATPLVEGMGVYLAAGQPDKQLLDILTGSSSLVWTICMVAFTVGAGWATNNTNLFSAVACAQSAMPKKDTGILTLLLGGISTLIACTDLIGQFEWVMNLIGLVVVSMGGVLLTGTRFPAASPKPLLLAWAAGSCVGLAALVGCITLSGVALCDAFATTALLTLANHLITARKVEVPT